MLDLTRHPRLLKTLSLLERAVGFFQRRNAGRPDADRRLAEFYARIWQEAADTLGATNVDLGHGVFEISLGGMTTRVQENSTALDDLATHCIVRTKPVVYRLLREERLPVPAHVVFDVADMSAAVRFLEQAERPCVVKPASGSGGRAVTTGVRSRWQLAWAAWAACAAGGGAVLEEQVAGRNFRLLYLDGELLDAVVRHPPTVAGDGVLSVRRLVQRANASRLEGQQSHGLLTMDLDMRRTLAQQGLTLRSVPAAGSEVVLKTVINENLGTDNVTATHLLCSELVAEGARAAAVTGVRLAGVDVITPDTSRPLKQAGGAILEVNSPPGYFWHYRKQDGPFPVAVHVLQALLGSPRQGHLPSDADQTAAVP
jgi:D-alanine-D-alanine ligase-like ATP-grasp enzyme